ncbi:eCIS core domain-containing protein [Frankia sp. AgKG'84/4]|uniref:eCIS core domain-containing protein n=1 Tax=Frankia sp. AgKG'84/4 TaxID=573490 RepID=UPI0035B3A01B
MYVRRPHGNSGHPGAPHYLQPRAGTAATAASALLALQRRAGNAAVAQAQAQARASVERALTSPGKPLPPAVLQETQTSMGADFSDVRIHTDGAADESARAV